MNPETGGVGSRQRADAPGAAALRVSGTTVALTAIVCVAILFRLAFIVRSDAATGGYKLISDDQDYEELALDLLAGRRYAVGAHDEEQAVHPPLYPLMLAALYRVFGHDHGVGRLANVLLASFTCLLVYAIGAGIFSRSVALGAAAFWAVYPTGAYLCAKLYTEPLYTFLLAAGTLVLARSIDRSTPAKFLGAGAAFGAAALTRAVGLGALGLATGWTLIAARPWRRGAACAGALAVAGAVLVGSSVLRNYRAVGRAAPVTTQSGQMLWLTFNPVTAGLQPPLTGPEGRDAEEVQAKFRRGFYKGRIAQPQHLPHWEEIEALPEAQGAQRMQQLAFGFIRDHPSASAKLLFWKLARGFGPPRERTRLKLLAYWLFTAPILLLGAAGAVAAAHRRVSSSSVLAVPIGAQLASMLWGYGAQRYRSPMDPFVAILAAFAVWSIIGLLKRRRQAGSVA